MVFALLIAILILAAVIALFAVPALKGYRTLIFGTIVSVGGGVLPVINQVFGYLQTLDWTQYVEAKYAPFALAGIGILVIILRAVTTGPVGEKP